MGLISLGGAAFRGDAQTLTTLCSAGDVSKQVGVRPAAPLLYAPDGLLYGSTSEALGVGIVRGAIFKISRDGSGLALVKQFTNALEGSCPQGRLVLDGDTLYGLTTRDGPSGGGTVFRVSTNGAGFSVLAALPGNSFTSSPHAIGGLTLAGSTLFGAAPSAGKSNAGTIFRLKRDGTDFVILKEFSGPDGAMPCGDLVLSGSTLFGTTAGGGKNSAGTIFRVETDGTGFATLKAFTFATSAEGGAAPSGGLVLADGVLYGTTLMGSAAGGSPFGPGTVFRIKTDGSAFQTIATLPEQDLSGSFGRGPVGTLVMKDNTLFGVTSSFLSLAPGPTVFHVKTNGSELIAERWAGAADVRAGLTLVENNAFGAAYDTVFSAQSGYVRNVQGHLFQGGLFHAFTGYVGEGGVNPVTRVGDYLYGTTALGGASNAGTIFRTKNEGTGKVEVLFSFPVGTNGYQPTGRLAVSGTNIFGMALGSDTEAVLYRVATDGRNYQVIRRFFIGDVRFVPPFLASPVVFNGHVYAAYRTLSGADAVVRMDEDGLDFRILDTSTVGELTVTDQGIYALAKVETSARVIRIDTNGVIKVINEIPNAYAAPPGRFAVVGNHLFGLVNFWTNGVGVTTRVFKTGFDGSDFELGESLNVKVPGDASNSSLVTDGNYIYGITQLSFSISNGDAIFRLSTNGTDPKVIYQFPVDRGDSQPNSDLIVENGILIGSTYAGGDTGQGTVFRLDLQPRLNIASDASGVGVAWPGYATDYILETATNLAATVWTRVGGVSITNNTLHTSGTSQNAFFRLRAP